MKLKHHMLLAGRQTEDTEQRLEKIRAAHVANPGCTWRDLSMICYETEYMIAKYFKMIKTV